MSFHDEKTIRFDSFEELINLLKALKQRAIHADYQNKHAPVSFIYWGIFKRTELGFAPYTHEHFHEWKTFASYVVANAHNLKNGQFIGRSMPSLFSASILPGEGDDFDQELFAVCGQCKFKKAIHKNRQRTGSLCREFATEQIWLVNQGPIYQEEFFGFPLYPKIGVCPSFLWERTNGASLKDKLRKAGREAACYFCRLPLIDLAEKDIVIHHKRPLATGGTHQLNNLEFAHRQCHDVHHRS